MYRIDNSINEGSGWIVESSESQYIYISTYRTLSGSSYVKLPAELRSPKKVLIYIKNKDQKFFLWCHVKYINPLKEHQERITKEDKKLVKDLDYDEIYFLVQENNFSKIEKKNNICINIFCYEDWLVFQKHISDQKFENSMSLLVVTDDDKSHYVYMNDFDRFWFHKKKNKNKKWFCRSYLQCFSDKNVLKNHKESYLSINGAQSVKLVKGIIEFKNYCRQIHCQFKIYCDFECNFEWVEI